MNTSSLVDTLLALPVFQSEWVLYLLIVLSVVSIAVIIERIAFYVRHRVDSEAVRRALGRALEQGDMAAAVKALEGHDALETNPVLAGLLVHDKGPESVEDLIPGALGRERTRYEKRLSFLATIASNAPYIGLFGTVLGIIRAYKDLSVNMAEASEAVMAGISEALLATAIGLLVAIPAVIAFNYFKGTVKTATTECELLARMVLAHLKGGDGRAEARGLAMAMRTLGRRDDDDVLASINIIPFVDIVLVLLVIFMLTSSAIAKASLKVELPKAATAGAAVETTVNLTLLVDGRLLIDGEPSTPAAAAALVAREAKQNPRTQAVISADRGVDYGQVISLIDLVKQNGITAFALDVERGTEPLPRPPAP